MLTAITCACGHTLTDHAACRRRTHPCDAGACPGGVCLVVGCWCVQVIPLLEAPC